jgi:hypothetical protein
VGLLRGFWNCGADSFSVFEVLLVLLVLTVIEVGQKYFKKTVRQ